MKALVTGSTGFIGNRLCRHLSSEGWQVRAFHRPSSSLRMLEDLPVEHAIGDLTQPETVQAAMEGMDAVFHAAALVGGHEKPGRIYTVTVEGTRTVMQAALEAGVKRVVHISSAASLGVPDEGPAVVAVMNENHSWNYRSDFWPYGYAKYLAEMEVQKAVVQGLDAVIVNPTVVFGAGDIYRNSTSIISQVARKRVPFLVEGGANFVHVQDVMDGISAAFAFGSRGSRYLLAGENLTHAELIESIAAITGVERPTLTMRAGLVRFLTGFLMGIQPFLQLPIDAVNFHQSGYYFFFDGRKAQVELRLPPSRPVTDAIKETWAWVNGSAEAIPQLHSSRG